LRSSFLRCSFVALAVDAPGCSSYCRKLLGAREAAPAAKYRECREHYVKSLLRRDCNIIFIRYYFAAGRLRSLSAVVHFRFAPFLLPKCAVVSPLSTASVGRGHYPRPSSARIATTPAEFRCLLPLLLSSCRCSAATVVARRLSPLPTLALLRCSRTAVAAPLSALVSVAALRPRSTPSAAKFRLLCAYCCSRFAAIAAASLRSLLSRCFAAPARRSLLRSPRSFRSLRCGRGFAASLPCGFAPSAPLLPHGGRCCAPSARGRSARSAAPAQRSRLRSLRSLPLRSLRCSRTAVAAAVAPLQVSVACCYPLNLPAPRSVGSRSLTLRSAPCAYVRGRFRRYPLPPSGADISRAHRRRG
jgi:hypothetical protein